MSFKGAEKALTQIVEAFLCQSKKFFDPVSFTLRSELIKLCVEFPKEIKFLTNTQRARAFKSTESSFDNDGGKILELLYKAIIITARRVTDFSPLSL